MMPSLISKKKPPCAHRYLKLIHYSHKKASKYNHELHTDCVKKYQELSHTEKCDYVNSDTFWSKFIVTKSKGDGFCFLYSLIDSIYNQLGIKLDIEDMIKHIFKECENFESYLPFIKGESKRIFTSEMHAYFF